MRNRAAGPKQAAQVRFPVEVVADLIRPAVEREGVEGFAFHAGVSARCVHRILHHTYRTVSLAIVDDLVTRGLERPELFFTDDRLAATFSERAA